MKKVLYQHGDVVFYEWKGEIPAGARKLSKKEIGKDFIIERGEGVHAHVLYSDLDELCDIIDIYEIEGKMYVKVKPGKSIPIKHEEHKTKTIEKPVEKGIEREYDYAQNEERRVID